MDGRNAAVTGSEGSVQAANGPETATTVSTPERTPRTESEDVKTVVEQALEEEVGLESTVEDIDSILKDSYERVGRRNTRAYLQDLNSDGVPALAVQVGLTDLYALNGVHKENQNLALVQEAGALDQLAHDIAAPWRQIFMTSIREALPYAGAATTVSVSTDGSDGNQTDTVEIGGEEITIEAESVSDPDTGSFLVNGEPYESDEEQILTVAGKGIYLNKVVQTDRNTSEGVMQFAIANGDPTNTWDYINIEVMGANDTSLNLTLPAHSDRLADAEDFYRNMAGRGAEVQNRLAEDLLNAHAGTSRPTGQMENLVYMSEGETLEDVNGLGVGLQVDRVYTESDHEWADVFVGGKGRYRVHEEGEWKLPNKNVKVELEDINPISPDYDEGVLFRAYQT